VVERSVGHRGVVGILPGHLNGDDLDTVGIDADMQLPPGPAAGCALLFDQPFAGAVEL
jgi:hypothetical protein